MEQKVWHHTEELQTTAVIIHILEDRLRDLSEQYEADIQRNTEKVQMHAINAWTCDQYLLMVE